MRLGLPGKLAVGLSLALLAVPVAAFAQSGNPPSPPYGLVFGLAAGATVGQPVIAIVTDGSSAANCGHDTVKSDSSEGVVYAVSINAQSQTAGCGQAGRQTRIYFVGSRGTASAFGAPTFTLDSTYQGGKRQNLTLGAALTNRLYAPNLRATP